MKVAISYTNTSEEHKAKILRLTDKLAQNGIDFAIDYYDLDIGADIYLFMEQLIMSEKHNYIFVICDRKYKEKADNNKGGVGFEARYLRIHTAVSAGNVIPIIFEHDNNGNPIRPNFLLPDKYIDLTVDNDFTSEDFKYLISWLKGNRPQKPKINIKIDFGNFSDDPDFEGLSKINNVKNTLKRKNHLSKRSRNVVSKMAELFEQNKFKDASAIFPLLLQCISGEGKTTIVSEFTHKYGLQFFATFYIDCQYSIKNQFANFASSDFLDIDIPSSIQKEEEKINFKKEKVKDYVNTNSVLLIFDNLDKLNAVEEYLPKAGKSRAILLTNDLSIKTPYFSKIEVPKLTEIDALEILFLGLIPSKDDYRIGKEIVGFLGFLPFGIELANSILLDENLPVDYFLIHLKQESIKWSDLQRRDGLNFIHSSPTIIALVEKKFSILKEDDVIHDLAKAVISCIGCMGVAHDEFSIKEIKKDIGCSENNTELLLKFNKAQKLLLQLGIDSDEKNFIIHTLTLEYIKMFLIQKNILIGYIDNKLQDIDVWINTQVTLGFWILLDTAFEGMESLLRYFGKHFESINTNDINILTHFIVQFCKKLDFFDNEDKCLKWVDFGLSICQSDRDFEFFDLRNDELLVWKAIALHKKEMYEEALDIYTGILAKGKLGNPILFIAILMYAGDIFRLKKNKEKALRCYEHANYYIKEHCEKHNLLSDVQCLVQKTKVLIYLDFFYTEFEMFVEKEQNKNELSALMNINLKDYDVPTQIGIFQDKSYLIKNEFQIFQLLKFNRNTYKPISYHLQARTIIDNNSD
jgi:hypothetical protein